MPIVLTQVGVNYFTYIVDGDGDGLADKDGSGFASRLGLDDAGNLTNEMVDAEGNIAPVASKMPEISVTSDWISDLSNNTYYYKYPVSPEDDSQTTDVVEDYTKELLNSQISLGTTTVGSKTYYQVLEVFADAIQSIPTEAVTSSWKVTVNDGVITAVN